MSLDKDRFVVFLLDEQRYALSLLSVDRIIRAVEVTPLPKAPDIVLGVINLQGEIVPVINVRKRFRMQEKEIEPTDYFLIAMASNRAVALIADTVLGVMERPAEEIVSAKQITPGIEYVKGILKLPDGLILIHDLNQFLSFEEEIELDEAMAGRSRVFSGD